MVGRLLTISLLGVAFAGSAFARPAPVEDRSATYYGERGGKPSPDWKVKKLKEAASKRHITVSRGDTLYGLAEKHNMEPRVIIDANKLKPPYRLKAGQSLYIPAPQTITVERGDSLLKIAKRYGVSMSDIARKNGIAKPYRLQVGQVLQMPQAPSYVANKPASLDKRNTISYAAKRSSRSVPKTQPASLDKRNTITSVAKRMSEPKPSITRQIVNTIRPKPRPESPIQSASLATISPSAGPNVATSRMLYDEGKKQVGHKTGRTKFSWPTRGTLLSSFGKKSSGIFNEGINISAQIGREIRAAAGGKVVYAGNGLRGYGNLIIIRHQGGWLSAYAHQRRFAVRKGERVEKGQVIGYVGDSGNVDRPQLHFAIRKGKEAQDPLKHLPI